MLKLQQELNLDPYAHIYDLVVPKDNFWRKLGESTDFSKAIVDVARFYSPNMGRGAINPAILLKLLIIREYYGYSYEDAIDETSVNLALRLFIGVELTQVLPTKSTLHDFAKQRLKDADTAQLLIEASVQAAVEAGVLKMDANGKKFIRAVIDSTHTLAANPRKLAFDALYNRCNQLSKFIIQSKFLDWDQPLEVPHFDNIEDLIGYTLAYIAAIKEKFPEYEIDLKLRNLIRRIDDDIKDIRDHGYTCSSDREARVGHKSATYTFFGYKSHIVVDAATGLAIAASVTPGNASDTTEGVELIKAICNDPTNNVAEVLGDSAYSSVDILKLAQENGFELYATPNPNLGSCKAFEHGFTYQKDADSLQCPAGHLAKHKSIRTDKRSKSKDKTQTAVYTFDATKCQVCPLKDKCYLGSKKTKVAEMPLLKEEQKELLARSQTEPFKQKFKDRAIIERINGNIKQTQSMRKAMGRGQSMMSLQTAIALFANNMKIIFKNKAPRY